MWPVRASLAAAVFAGGSAGFSMSARRKWGRQSDFYFCFHLSCFFSLSTYLRSSHLHEPAHCTVPLVCLFFPTHPSSPAQSAPGLYRMVEKHLGALSHQLAIPKRQSPSTGPQLAALQFADFKPFISYTFGAPGTLIARC